MLVRTIPSRRRSFALRNTSITYPSFTKWSGSLVFGHFFLSCFLSLHDLERDRVSSKSLSASHSKKNENLSLETPDEEKTFVFCFGKLKRFMQRSDVVCFVFFLLVFFLFDKQKH